MDSIVILLDVGKGMYHDIDDRSNVIPAITIIRSMIQRKLFSSSKDEMALILCGSKETYNPLNRDNSTQYKHIKIHRELSRINWEFLEELNDNFDYHGETNYDLFEGLIVATDYLKTKHSGRKIGAWHKRIIVVSNLNCEIDWSELVDVLESLKSEEIEVDLISNRELPDNKNDAKQNGDILDDNSTCKITDLICTNEQMFDSILSATEGDSYSFNDALIALNYFEMKTCRPNGWKFKLEISNITSLDITGYVKVKESKVKSMKNVYGGDPNSKVITKTTYHLNQNDEEEVDQDDIITGYRYGASLVPFNEEDVKSMALEVEKSMKLIGFTEEENIKLETYLGDNSTLYFPTNPEQTRVFAALVQAMFESGVVAVVRRVYSKASSPKLATLAPRIKDGSCMLVYREIAFGEDIRHYRFASLTDPNQPSTSSASNTNNIQSNNSNITSVIDAFIDKLILTEVDEKTDETTELYKPSRIINPTIQLFFQGLSQRYFHPSEPLPSQPDETLMRNVTQRSPIEGLQDIIDQISQLFPTRVLDAKNSTSSTKTGEKKKIATELFPSIEEELSIKRQRHENQLENDSNPSQINLSGLLNEPTNQNILLNQMQVHISGSGVSQAIDYLTQHLATRTNHEDDTQLLQCIKILRQNILDMMMIGASDTTQPDPNLPSPLLFNTFAKSIKLHHSQLFNLLKQNGMGLISISEAKLGSTPEECDQFLDNSPMDDDSLDYLFDDM